MQGAPWTGRLVLSLALPVALGLAIAACKVTVEDTNAPYAVLYDAGKVDSSSFAGALPFDDNAISKIDSSKLIADPHPCHEPMLAKVFGVADGDTIDVNEVDVDGSAGLRIRLIGVDSPEVAHGTTPADCYGDEATAFTKQLLGHFVWLTFGDTCIDKYDRTLAYVHLNTTESGFFQRQLLRRGFASAFIFSDNAGQRTLFEGDEAIAKSSKVGLWAACPGK